MKFFFSSNAQYDRRLPLSFAELGAMLEHFAQVFSLKGCAVTLRLAHDEEIRLLNQRFMGCLGPTNILSFPAQDTTDSLGELVLSVDTLLREIRLYNQDALSYTVRLLAHGLLHLLGYEHGRAMDELTELAVDSWPEGLCPPAPAVL